MLDIQFRFDRVVEGKSKRFRHCQHTAVGRKDLPRHDLSPRARAMSISRSMRDASKTVSLPVLTDDYRKLARLPVGIDDIARDPDLNLTSRAPIYRDSAISRS